MFVSELHHCLNVFVFHFRNLFYSVVYHCPNTFYSVASRPECACFIQFYHRQNVFYSVFLPIECVFIQLRYRQLLSSISTKTRLFHHLRSHGLESNGEGYGWQGRVGGGGGGW